MKKYILGISIMIAVVIIAVAACSKSSSSTPTPTPTKPDPTTPAASATVSISNFAFSPATVTVKAGQSVAWTNADTAPHTVADVNGDFSSSTLNQSDKYSHTFATAGTYTYKCTIHSMMATATVVVTN